MLLGSRDAPANENPYRGAVNKGRQWSTEYRSLDSLKPAAMLAVTFVIKLSS